MNRDLFIPITEIEKAELLSICKEVLKEYPLNLLRRLLIESDLHRKECPKRGGER